MNEIERNARNQALFRDVNEEIETLHDQRFGGEERFAIVCECGRADCDARFAVTREEYEALRAEPTHFLVARDHLHPGVEEVVAERDGYLIVENVGVAAHIARRTYPRAR